MFTTFSREISSAMLYRHGKRIHVCKFQSNTAHQGGSQSLWVYKSVVEQVLVPEEELATGLYQ